MNTPPDTPPKTAFIPLKNFKIPLYWGLNVSPSRGSRTTLFPSATSTLTARS